ncbi:hypothetical protein [Metabacillus sediminilitoris]|nr:hypothetical protein [Metabacillus sediminilitoris]
MNKRLSSKGLYHGRSVQPTIRKVSSPVMVKTTPYTNYLKRK